MLTCGLPFSPGAPARWGQVFPSRAVFCIWKRKDRHFYGFTDGKPSLSGGWKVTKVILFSRADVQHATKCWRAVLEHRGLSIPPTTIKTQVKNGITL